MTRYFMTIRLKKLLKYNLEAYKPKKLDLRAFNKKNCWK